ncbi:hypothetical protein AB0J51_01325 [Micromonospora echinofusca]|uniref:hypothetical protein n=1 Tax=Micromonospora echinofusca TaxID=47858 RepID=UPI00342203F2
MTPPADAPVRPPRPVTVTIAFWLQLVMRAVPDADPDEVRGERWSNVTMAVVLGLPTLLLAGWLAATARPVRRGGNVARVMVFVAGGVQLVLCCAQSLVGVLVFPLLFAFGFDDGPYVEGEYPPEGPAGAEAEIWAESKFIEALYARPDPFEAVLFPLAGLGVLTVLLLTVSVVLLLALPPAHRWFVPRTEPPAVPLPPGAYPLFPAYASATVPGAYGAAPPGHLLCPDPAAHRPSQRPEAPGTGPAEG